ncbi:hypothetical protein [Bacillus sp. ISL-7]|uniref:hypothetical protein n=1 Tax=Bacillus sp. ISL-7 TaxID=2819136 RepID=UPI001BEC8DAC|nr:hypothetical protein [Bacillus sp. ISL-7]MBT2736679.1 hypothetical protein [Bacillus sp. ISL-7]
MSMQAIYKNGDSLINGVSQTKIHYDMFPNNRDNPAYFVDYLFHHYPTQKFHMMVPGERFIYHK